MSAVYAREEFFELMADAGQVRVDRVGLDVLAHVHNIVAEGVLCWCYREFMKFAKVEIQM